MFFYLFSNEKYNEMVNALGGISLSFVQPKVTNFRKQYVLKHKDGAYIQLDPMEYSHYKEGKENEFDWKWIQLPMKMNGRYLNKLMFFNNTDEKLVVTVLIRYETQQVENSPFIYYSPTREAIIYFDNEGYRLFGGVAEQSIEEKYSTVPIHLDKWKIGFPFPIQPLQKRSEGWGMEFSLELQPRASNYLYEWEFCNDKLHEIEELHSRYQELLGKRQEASL